MNERIPTVQKGEPITADAWNKLVAKINEQPAASVASTGAAVKGEFWIKNTTSTVMPAFAPVYITGLASSFSNEADAKTAIASDRVVFNAALTGSDSTAVYAQLLESVSPGYVGRAALPYGAAVLTTIYDDGLTTANGTRATIRSHSFRIAPSGDFKILLFDDTSRFALLSYEPLETEYTAGTGINISNNEISSNTSFCWGAPKTSGSGTDVVTTATNGYNSGASPNLLFSSKFKRVSSDGGYCCDLNSRALQVVTGVDFTNQTTTTKWISAIYSD